MSGKIQINENIKGLIFDLDGTLAHTMPLHYKAWQKVAERHGFVFEEELFYLWAGIPTAKVVERLNELKGYQLEAEIVLEEKDRYFLEWTDLIKPIDPVVAVVKDFYGKLPLAVGTGGRRKFAVHTLEALGLQNFFEVVVCAEDVKEHKPHPETFLQCAKGINVKPESCLVFEDGEQGIQAAQAARMQIIDVRPFLG